MEGSSDSEMAPVDVAKLNEKAVENFRHYLKIQSVQPNVNYDDCVKFLKKQATGLGIDSKVFEIVKGKPVVILTLKGTTQSLPSILLNSHMDVVPVFRELWTHGPFDAEMDKNGNIYARGAQDMKCVGIQYLEAVRRITLKGLRLKRTIHISFVPDEEIGGVDGMKKFVKSIYFKQLNVGFVLDEGYPSPTNTMFVFNAERFIWQIEFKVTGPDGHGSLLIENTAAEKMTNLINKLMDFRQAQLDKLKGDNRLTIGDVTSVNLTLIKGGVESNVIPAEFNVTFDFRLSLDTDEDNFESMINKWMAESGDGIQMKFLQKGPKVPATTTDKSNPFWVALQSTFETLKIRYKLCTFPGGTDGRYCREVGLPVIGISPILNTTPLLHARDEYVNKDMFVKGIDVYEAILMSVANMP